MSDRGLTLDRIVSACCPRRYQPGDPKGGCSKRVSLVAEGFDGPLAVVDSHNSRVDRLFERQSEILIPVNGTDASRRAAEVAFRLARACAAQVTVLYVTRTGAAGKRAGGRRARTARRNEEAVLKDIATLADRCEVRVRRSIRGSLAPDEAIIKEAKRGYDLIVLGANRRPGDTLVFWKYSGSRARSLGDIETVRRQLKMTERFKFPACGSSTGLANPPNVAHIFMNIRGESGRMTPAVTIPATLRAAEQGEHSWQQ
jgi:nucleotide-binding universal stress UspA family protein